LQTLLARLAALALGLATSLLRGAGQLALLLGRLLGHELRRLVGGLGGRLLRLPAPGLLRCLLLTELAGESLGGLGSAVELRLRIGWSAGTLERLASLGHLRLGLLALLGGSLAIKPTELTIQLLLFLLSATQGFGLPGSLDRLLRL